MAGYVDGFVLIVPKKHVKAYKKMATEAGKMWKDLGALDYKECQGDDLKRIGMGGEFTWAFPDMAKAGKDETVWFSFITYKSRKHRDEVNKKVNAEMKKQADKHKNMPMPFDMKRMAYGGFKIVVDA